jgi:hypothetical protein
MTAFATQADGKGWTCAAAEMRAAALKAKAAVAGMADVPDPPRSAWQKLIDRSLSEADPDGDLIALLEAAANDAATRGYTKVRDLLRDASRDVRRSIRLVRITEEPPAKTVQFVIAAATSPTYVPTKATVDTLKGLATQLDSLGYVNAAGEARSMADVAQKKIDAATTVFATPSSLASAEFGTFDTTPTDPLASLPDAIRDAVSDAYDSGDPQKLDDVAADKLVPYPYAWKKVKADAAAIRARWTVPLASMPTGKGTDFAAVYEEVGSPGWMASPIYLWADSAPWVPDGRAVGDALWKRGYKKAANDLGWMFEKKAKAYWNVDALYPPPV